jgi:predicted DNA-binding mobile mystery protein A
MGVDPTAVSHLEKREAAGKITLESLRRAAEAMDARLVYAIVPNQSLRGTLQDQAVKVAQASLRRIGHTMDLEAHGVGPEESAHQEADMVNRLLLEWPRSLWDQPDAPKKRRGG